MPEVSNLTRPIERRIAIFDARPGDRQLGTDLGYGLMGGSPQKFDEDSKFFKVGPQTIPPKFVAIWMYFVLAAISITFVCMGIKEMAAWGIVIGGAILIVPTMIAMFSWINHLTGKEPFLVFDKVTGIVELPRLASKYSVKQLREVIFLDRFVDRNQHWHIGLLAEEGNGSWTYLHLFNTAHICSGNGSGWLGFKDDDQKIAEALGIGFRRITFTKDESLELASLVPWLNRTANNNAKQPS
ncbi:hypothetical protein [Mariniblastus fucicola]|uniref:Uncharacterized protein n=1 Tax=Mariniblastus fucicola TaxID=980251 RepID=A0A5B9P8V6_9BACT|nr:hypothetical protein [Mariniblastus fucicola]QEG23167.1 hypothetical protein MFFC18_30630 [Mariniblastus fucicola]